MLMMRAGSLSLAALRSCGSSSRVRWNGALTLTDHSLSNAESGYSSIGAPQVAPALLMSTFSAGSRSAMADASVAQPASSDTSTGSEMHSPFSDSSAAVASQTSALRAVM